jgi:hypothetical protein
MPHHDKHPQIKVKGEITHVFAHRFVLKTGSETVLADLTPRGLEKVNVRVGDDVVIEGERKLSEIKVFKLQRDGKMFEIGHAPHHKHEHDHAPADPALAIKAAASAGYQVIGEVRRKPKHYEVLGKKAAAFEELHIELNGDIRKTKPVSPDDHKWQFAIEQTNAS